jgi:hypothetical protein
MKLRKRESTINSTTKEQKARAARATAEVT